MDQWGDRLEVRPAAKRGWELQESDPEPTDAEAMAELQPDERPAGTVKPRPARSRLELPSRQYLLTPEAGP
jgi:hypothetical protein